MSLSIVINIVAMTINLVAIAICILTWRINRKTRELLREMRDEQD